ncbi:MAG: amidohydrolase family protein, partial [Solirubrobacterales bacterium]|nr:amidohydrolase family protein [Solirubrobacterales bacterium]
TRVDVHQHIWTEPLLEALAARDRLPFVDTTDGIAVLHCAGEQAWAIDIESESTQARAELARADGLDQAIIAPSSPIGIEALPRDEASELIEAHLAGVEALGSPFAAWGPVALDRPDPDDIDARLDRGCAGITLPAGALASPDTLREIEPLLARAEALGAMVFVHPGPAPGQRRAGAASLTEPLWWAALTEYVAQMQAAWLTFATLGRRRHPALRILFAILAGGAPLQAERLAARGGPPVDLRDPLTFYETSSYGSAAIEAIAHCAGAEQLVYGSDRPVIEPLRTVHDLVLQTNAARVLGAAIGHPSAVAA